MKKTESAKIQTILVFAAFVISVVVGLLLENHQDIALMFKPLGDIYINLIKMIMVPLVFSSLVLGIANVDSVRKIGKMGIWTVVTFLCTTAVAVVIGLILSNIFKPGVGMSVADLAYEGKEMPSVLATITGIFPSNILQALLDANMLQIIFISLILGVAVVRTSESGYGSSFKKVVEDVFQIMITITRWIMVLTPLGVLGLMIPTVAQNGLSVILPLIKVILVFYLGVVIQNVVIYGGLLKTQTRVSVKEFISAMAPAQLLAFISCSSAAALPVSMERMQDKLHVSKEVSGFVLPLGATINMDGNAIYQGIVSLFVAQAFGLHLSLPMQAVVVLTGTAASIGAAGVPGAGVVVLSTVLSSVGLPIEGVALIAGIDRILDMGRTFTNVTGDAVTALIVEDKVSGKR